MLCPPLHPTYTPYFPHQNCRPFFLIFCFNMAIGPGRITHAVFPEEVARWRKLSRSYKTRIFPFRGRHKLCWVCLKTQSDKFSVVHSFQSTKKKILSFTHVAIAYFNSHNIKGLNWNIYFDFVEWTIRAYEIAWFTACGCLLWTYSKTINTGQSPIWRRISRNCSCAEGQDRASIRNRVSGVQEWIKKDGSQLSDIIL